MQLIPIQRSNNTQKVFGVNSVIFFTAKSTYEAIYLHEIFKLCLSKYLIFDACKILVCGEQKFTAKNGKK